MIHPSTELRHVSPSIGYGVFATSDIPKGTIVYAKDPLDIAIGPEEYSALDVWTRESVDKYSYTQPDGLRIVSWDNAKYVNHSCECNTLSTGWGFEIAIRDIHCGEEITDDYGLFNPLEDFDLECGCSGCRMRVTISDMDRFHRVWDCEVRDALKDLYAVEQPLWYLLDGDARDSLNLYSSTGMGYRSVRLLRCDLELAT